MIEIDGRDRVDPRGYAEKGHPHDLWTRLRKQAPLNRDEGVFDDPFAFRVDCRPKED